MKKPVFFLSSTIHDFKDLRSALKFYLEEQGCIVQASETNDFLKPLDQHSYQACLSSISNADYFILLIGSRVGGWFDKSQKISITQREYREAYELHKSGKLKILTFVRSEVWQHKQSRKDLAKYLETLELNEEIQKSIINSPSKFATDSEFIINFLEEVARIKETNEAVQNKLAFPTGNWLHSFSNYKEIIDVLQTQIFAGIPADKAAFRKLLGRELKEILRSCLIKYNNSLLSPINAVVSFCSQNPITTSNKLKKFITVEPKSWDSLSWVGIGLIAKRIHTIALGHLY